jgi:Pvc16 N-terminal domain
MLHNVLPVLGYQLNEFLSSEYGLSEDRVVVSSLVDLRGNMSSQIENRVVVTLLNIEEEKSIRNGQLQSYSGMNPPVFINLYVLFSANFPDTNYLESLKFISSVISFFQGKNVFDKMNTPMLSDNVDKIVVEFINSDLQQLTNLWGMLGAKYIPSVVYKLKMLTFSSNTIVEEVPLTLVSNLKRKKTSGIDFTGS